MNSEKWAEVIQKFSFDNNFQLWRQQLTYIFPFKGVSFTFKGWNWVNWLDVLWIGIVKSLSLSVFYIVYLLPACFSIQNSILFIHFRSISFNLCCVKHPERELTLQLGPYTCSWCSNTRTQTPENLSHFIKFLIGYINLCETTLSIKLFTSDIEFPCSLYLAMLFLYSRRIIFNIIVKCSRNCKFFVCILITMQLQYSIRWIHHLIVRLGWGKLYWDIEITRKPS